MALGSSDPAPVVLVAEDEEFVRLYAADLLPEAGYKVIDVASADAALEAMAEQPDIRVLFTDIQMPGMLDGIQLARSVHEQWPDVSCGLHRAADSQRRERSRTTGIFRQTLPSQRRSERDRRYGQRTARRMRERGASRRRVL
jgi:CheY-like chemotaxis protein